MNKKRGTWIDIVIVVVVVAVIGGIIWYGTRDGDQPIVSAGKVNITFIAEADKVPNEALDQIKIGDAVVASGRFQEAVIKDFQITPSYDVTAHDGEFVMVEDYGKSKITVTIEGQASKVGPTLDIGGQTIKAGNKYYIKTDVFEAYGLIVNIVEVED